jgi:hypothetical protein
MDAPKGRYSVVEKDGRLIVIDNGTGAPIRSSIAPPPARAGRAGSARPPPVSGRDPGPVDRAAARLVALDAREWDGEGRAIIAWKWEQNGQDKSWNAALDERQQRRFGRALLALCAVVLIPVVILFAGSGASVLAALLILPPAAWGAVSLQRLYRETNDPELGPS